METLNFSNFAKKIKISSLINKIIPKLDNQKVKGDNGVVGVIGGSFEYTGAPYYSGIAALKSGSDLSHIFCHVDAAIPIKSYSPELIVHPAFDDTKSEDLLEKTARWFKSLDALVIGPGLGRQDSTLFNFKYLLYQSLALKDLIHIIDADGLWHFANFDTQKNTQTIMQNENLIVFTPNRTEFKRLCEKSNIIINEASEKLKKSQLENFEIDKEEVMFFEDINSENLQIFKNEIELAKALNNKVIIHKGKFDTITNGLKTYIVGNPGSLKRCGGIGDILNGLIATFSSMKRKQLLKMESKMTSDDLLEVSALACYICKEASKNAYDKHGFSLTAPDVIVEVARLAVNYQF